MKLKYLIALVLTLVITMLLWLLLPAQALASGQETASNVNSRYDVEAVSVTGVPDAELSQALRGDMQRMVGSKYDQSRADELAGRLRSELHGYRVTVKVLRGNEPDRVLVEYQAQRKESNAGLFFPQFVYHSREKFSGAVRFGLETHHNVVSAGFANSSDELLERSAGYTLSYEHRRVGTDIVQLKIEFGRYYQTFNDAIVAAASASPDAPDIYRRRQHFAPAVMIVPRRDLTFRAGLSFQDLGIRTPVDRTVTAYAFTSGIHFNRTIDGENGMTHAVVADYDLRAASRALDSDLVYTRHLATADYALSQDRHRFGAHARFGYINGRAPLFERLSLGSTLLLRGWDKFDVAPLGGAKLAYGSLEYRYRPFRVFYDVGAVWDRDEGASARHAIGIGLVSRQGFFVSVGFPVRLHEVKPMVMFGIHRELP